MPLPHGYGAVPNVNPLPTADILPGGMAVLAKKGVYFLVIRQASSVPEK